MEILIAEEKKKIEDDFGGSYRNPKLYMEYMKNIKTTTWAAQIVGAYKYTIDNRMKSILKSQKARVEKQNAKGESKVYSYWKKAQTIGGYFMIIMMLMGMLGPALIMNQIR